MDTHSRSQPQRPDSVWEADLSTAKRTEIPTVAVHILQQQGFLPQVLNSLFTFVGVLSPTGLLLEANEALLQTVEASDPEVLGSPFAEARWWTYSPSAQPLVCRAIAAASQGEVFRFTVPMQLKVGVQTVIDTTFTPLRDETGRVCYVLFTGTDVCQQGCSPGQLEQVETTARQALAASHARFQSFMNQVPMLAWLVDETGRMQYVNQAFLEFIGRDLTEVVGQPLEALFPAEFAADYHRKNQQVINRQTVIETIEQAPTLAGDVHSYLVRKFPVWQERQRVCAGGIAVDVTKRQNIETALKESEAQLQQKNEELEVFLSSAPDLLCIAHTDGHFIQLNAQWERTLGYPLAALEGRQFLELVHPEDVEATLAAMTQLSDQQPVMQFVNRYRHQDGTYRWLEWRSIPQGTLIYATARDISDRIHTEVTLQESEARFRSAFEDAAIGMAMVSPAGGFLRVNRSLCEILGYPETELLQKDFQTITYPDDLAADLAYVEQLLGGERRTYQMEKRYFHASGRIVWALLSVSLVRNIEGNPLYFIAQVQDITVSKRAMTSLETSLQEKEVLLKEIHHRVKNNLQVINSLFRLQCRTLKNPEVTTLPTESQNRLRSMALIHEQLYSAQTLSSIHLRDYVTELTANLMRSYQVTYSTLHLTVDIPPTLAIDIDTAVPCGLIINELVSNTLKYAFAPGTQGNLWIRASQNAPHQFTLTVGDNGRGLPADLDIHRTPTLGLTLVNDLVDQLRGTLAVDTHDGTQFSITIRGQGG